MFYTSGKDVAEEGTPGEWNVEIILRHRLDRNCKIEFLVRWEGYCQDEDTWEKPEAFLPQFSRPWATYCKGKKLNLNVLDYLKTGAQLTPPAQLRRTA